MGLGPNGTINGFEEEEEGPAASTLVPVEETVDVDGVALVPPVVLDNPDVGGWRLENGMQGGNGSLRNRGLDTVGEKRCRTDIGRVDSEFCRDA